MSNCKSFDISREGKNLRLRIAATDVTVSRLSRAFQVEPCSLYLKEEFGDMTFWPTDSGRFNVMHLNDGSALLIMGEDLMPSTSNVQLQQMGEHSGSGHLSQVFAYGASAQTGSSKSPLFGGARRKNGAIAKVIHAEICFKNEKGPPTFQELGQTYVNIKEETANVNYVLSKARDAFNDASLEMVTSNGLKIVDNEGTRGFAFWKCGSRKVYAVRLGSSTRAKRMAKTKAKSALSSVFEVSDDSDEDFMVASKKPRGDIEIVKSDISEIKSMVTDILQVNQILLLPLGVVKLIKDAFICKICRATPMKPPVIATKCCNSLLGCEDCVNTWYEGAEGLSKKCPNCNEPRGYASTFQFKGMDEFLVGVRDLVSPEENDPSL